MKRLTFVPLCVFFVLFQQIICAQDRTLLAEGDSVALTTKGTKPLSHWKMWRVDNGYEVIDSSVQNASFIQIFRFDSKLMPIGFSKKTGPLDLPDSRFPKFPASDISCEYKTKEIACESLAEDGARTTTTIAAVSPYVVVGEFYDLDFLWFMTGVVHLAAKEKSGGLVNVYALTSGKELGLKADQPIRVIPDGNGSATVLGREQPVKKYRLGSDGRLLTGTEQGFIAKIQPKPNLELGFAIDNYKEYEPWSFPF
jgi:hypothetical protein